MSCIQQENSQENTLKFIKNLVIQTLDTNKTEFIFKINKIPNNCERNNKGYFYFNVNNKQFISVFQIINFKLNMFVTTKWFTNISNYFYQVFVHCNGKYQNILRNFGLLSSQEDLEILETYHEGYCKYTQDGIIEISFPIISDELAKLIPENTSQENIDKLNVIVDYL